MIFTFHHPSKNLFFEEKFEDGDEDIKFYINEKRVFSGNFIFDNLTSYLLFENHFHLYQGVRKYSFSFSWKYSERCYAIWCKVVSLFHASNSGVVMLGKLWWELSKIFEKKNLKIELRFSNDTPNNFGDIWMDEKFGISMMWLYTHHRKVEICCGNKKKTVVEKRAYSNEVIVKDLFSLLRINEREIITASLSKNSYCNFVGRILLQK